MICGALGSTANTLIENGIKFTPLSAPQIFNLEEIPINVESEAISYLKAQVSGASFIIFSHMRHHWVCGESYESSTWFRENKNNQWLIRGFHLFIKRFPESNAKLVLVTWGKDVEASRVLCSQLGLDRSIIWLPLLKRREIFWILNNCCAVAVGEFVCSPGEYWGSTAFEALSIGIPLMQTVNFTDYNYYEIFGHPLPLLLDVRSDEDVKNHLTGVFLNRDEARTKFFENSKWFNDYNGTNLAKKWLDIVMVGG